MTQEKKLIYDESFKDELVAVISYISYELKNPDAAERFSIAIQEAILNRFAFPGTFEPYHPSRSLNFEYYRIYVGNYTIFYYYNGTEMHISHLFYSAADIPTKL